MSRPTDFFAYKNNVLTVDGVPLPEIAESTGTPVYVYSAEGLLRPFRELKKGLEGLDPLICFAVKSNSNVAILRLLANEGAGMDIVSGGELYRAGIAGVPGRDIVFSGVGKTPGEMARALEYGETGIFSFNVESEPELHMLSAVAQHMGRTAPIALRFNPDVDPKTHPYISTGLKKNKFGLNRKEILEIARDVSRYPGITIRGISIHIGSQLLSLAPLEDAFKRTRALLSELETLLPEPIRFVDLGGGVGITYRNEKTIPIPRYCAMIRKHFGPGARSGRPLKILIEPGRSISGNAGVLLSEVLYRKMRKEKDFLIVDAGMNDLVRPSLYGSFHDIVPVARMNGVRKKTDVVGPVCESGDCFASERPLPRKLDQGDLVAILSAGAYGFAMAGNYNSRPRAPEVLARNGRFELIRERETYEDLVRGEAISQPSRGRESAART
ncbi:MAG: diaminopimelate decarboxylase [Oligoflexia bacterium]|nr:diaminopimelate decarboxylase [Oligoflexia bacterium]